MGLPDVDRIYSRLSVASNLREDIFAEHKRQRENSPPSFESEVVSQDSLRIFASIPDPIDSAIMVKYSSWLHLLRTSLDGLFYRLATIDSPGEGGNPTRPGNRQFPLAKTKKEFEKAKSSSMRGLSDWVISALEGVQPYNIPTGEKGHSLWWLHDLARHDRHRDDISLLDRVNRIQFTFSEGTAGLARATFLADQHLTFLKAGERVKLLELSVVPAFWDAVEGVDIWIGLEPDSPYWMDNVVEGFRWTSIDRMRSIEDIVGATVDFFEFNIDQRPKLEGRMRYTDGKWVQDR